MADDERRRAAERAVRQIREAMQPSQELMRVVQQNARSYQRVAEQMRQFGQPAKAIASHLNALDRIAEQNRRLFGGLKDVLPNNGALAVLPAIKVEFDKLPPAIRSPDLFQNCISNEIQRLGHSLASIPEWPYAALTESMLSIQQPRLAACADVARRLTEALHALSEPLKCLQEDNRVAEIVLELGFVPHGALWAFFAEFEGSPEDRAAIAEDLAHKAWRDLKDALVVDQDGCMGDEKLTRLYAQMLVAHDNGLYELVRSAMPGALERGQRVSFAPARAPRDLRKWLETEGCALTSEALGGIRGYRVWKVLLDHTFAPFQQDEEADAIKFPNRHSAAHGGGKQVATVVDSLNAILLTHYVIELAQALKVVRKAHAA